MDCPKGTSIWRCVGFWGMIAVVSEHGVTFEGEMERRAAEWRGRRLDELEVVYWVDGVYVKAGFERDPRLVVIGASQRWERLSAEPGYRFGLRCCRDRKDGLSWW